MCFGLIVQRTYRRPFRITTLQFLHIVVIDARTFIIFYKLFDLFPDHTLIFLVRPYLREEF